MKKLLIVLLCLFFIVPCVAAKQYEDVNDDCSNTSKIQALGSILIVNSTFIDFNNTVAGTPTPEDTGDYTEVDGAFNAIIVDDSDSVTIWSDLDEVAYLYRDLGVDGIGDFEAEFMVDTVSSVLNGRNYAFGVSNELGDWNSQTDSLGFRVRYSTGDSKYQFSLAQKEAGVNLYQTYLSTSSPPDYYVTFKKIGVNLVCELYSDSARTTLVTNLTSTTSTDDKYRYLYWGFTDDVSLGGRDMRIQSNDLTGFSTTGATDASLYTKNLLENVTGNGAALLTNTNLEGTNSITVEVSSNNSTWNQLNGTLDNGYDARNLEEYDYSTLYLRFNFSRPSGIGNCSLENYKVIYNTTIAAGAGGSLNRTEWNITSLHIVAGTYDSGSLSDTYTKDGAWYRVDESTGSPCLDVRMNFTGINATVLSLSGRLYSRYEGNPAHIIRYEAFNFSSNSWVVIATKSEHDFEWSNHSISLHTEWFVDAGRFWGRINHVSNGAIGHYIDIDYMKLIGYVPVPAASSTGGGESYWLIAFIFIVFPVIIYLVYRRRKR